MEDEYLYHLEIDKPYQCLDLEDLPNEIWIDAFGYDGIYEVSNLGRVKSLEREVPTRWGTTTVTIPTKILKQSIVKAKNGRVCGLIVNIGRKSRTALRFIFECFHPDVDFLPKECVMHVNKNLLDNRIDNLKKVTRGKSKATDMVKSIPTIICTPKNLKKANEANREFYDNRTHKECSTCGKIDMVEDFPDNVSRCQRCINNYNIKKRNNYTYKNKKKTCNRCSKIKWDKDFPKANNTCKKCRYESYRIFQLEQKENLGDSYVKQYGKNTYGYKEFTPDLIDELREEIKEKRKPKHIYDNKEFINTKAFAEYISSKYKVPVTTVKQRIGSGKTEYECTLNRTQFLRHNKNK